MSKNTYMNLFGNQEISIIFVKNYLTYEKHIRITNRQTKYNLQT